MKLRYLTITTTEGGCDTCEDTDPRQVTFDRNPWHNTTDADAADKRDEIMRARLGDEVSLDGCSSLYVLLPEQKKDQGMSREEVFKADMYRFRDQHEGGIRSRKKDLKIVTKAHAETLGGLPERLYMPQAWVCGSYGNPAVYCVYDLADDPAADSCLYCHDPMERK